MLTDDQIAEALDLIDSRYHDVITKYLRKVGKTVNQIGHLNQSSVNLLVQLRRMGVDAKTIQNELQKATLLTKRDIKKLYQKAAEESHGDARIEYLTKGKEPENIRWEALVEDIWKQTAGAMDNLANSSVITEGYRNVIDKAVQAVTMGAADYNSAIRDAVKSIGREGIQVEYESTYIAADGTLKHHKRRLDSAVRQNVLDGIRQVQQKAQELIGEEIGADGVDISAHPNSAPDHEPVQGRRFDLDNFQKMQSAESFEDVDGHQYSGFDRPITQWRCRHLVFYILLGITRRMYTDEQLKQWEEDNQEGCIIDGKPYTNYEATQLMRNLETEIRRQKDTAVLAKESGDDVLRRECQSNINKLTKKYNAVAEAAGLRKQMQKTYVEGFAPVRESVFKNPPEDLEELSSAVGKELDSYCERKSKWSGNTIIGKRDDMVGVAGKKLWSCDILLREDADIKATVHEHLHARSVSYYDRKTYSTLRAMEEGPVELFAQEICKRNGARFSESYTTYVKQLRIFTSITRVEDKYRFAKQLFDIPLPERYNWLRQQADAVIASNKLSRKTVQALNEALDKLKSNGGVNNGG